MDVQVINATREQVLAEHGKLANTFGTRFFGLMGRAGLEPGHALLIYPSSSIHMFFMRFSIDAVFVDRQDCVVGVFEALPPNRPYAGAKGARYVIELPTGTIAATQTQPGDQLTLNPSPHPPRKR